MKIAFIGDCLYNTGPSNVNKAFRRYLEKRVYFLKSKDKAFRVLETFFSVCGSDVVIISGLSHINNLARILAEICHKPIVYIMHGCYIHEADLNRFQRNEKSVIHEMSMLCSAKRIVAVSEQYGNWVKNFFPQFKEKVSFINNGIEWDYYDAMDQNREKRNPYLILSMGGGRPQKNNLQICKAVQVLNEKYHQPFEYVVLGRDYEDTPAIKKSPFTKYMGQVSRQEAAKWYQRANLYIQNSIFEPFGLAPIEALCSGCNILISKHVGARSVIDTIKEEDTICDCYNTEEIVQKILNIHSTGNCKRLLNGINRETSSCSYASERLVYIAKEVYRQEKDSNE